MPHESSAFHHFAQQLGLSDAGLIAAIIFVVVACAVAAALNDLRRRSRAEQAELAKFKRIAQANRW